MSELFDKLVESAGQVIAEVDKGGQIQSTISGLRARLAEADRKRKVSQIKQAVGDLRNQEAQAINALSAQVLALHEAGTLTQPELVSLCKGVDDIRKQIRDKEAELEQLQPAQPPERQTVAAQNAVQPPEPARLRCPQCGASVLEGAAFCQNCGARQMAEATPSPVLYCVHCGAELRKNARFCPKCGQTVAT
jgi:RNA polymerase subunit RPABC4/transcription elongation factor Spt4